MLNTGLSACPHIVLTPPPAQEVAVFLLYNVGRQHPKKSKEEGGEDAGVEDSLIGYFKQGSLPAW